MYCIGPMAALGDSWKPGTDAELAGDPVGLHVLVTGEAVADEHEVLGACLLDHLRRVHQRGVIAVPDDLAAVDAAERVAPLDHGVHGVAELLVEARGGGVALVVAVTDRDRVVGDALLGRAGGVALAAGRLEVAEGVGRQSGLGRGGRLPVRGGRVVALPVCRAAGRDQQQAGCRDAPTGDPLVSHGGCVPLPGWVRHPTVTANTSNLIEVTMGTGSRRPCEKMWRDRLPHRVIAITSSPGGSL